MVNFQYEHLFKMDSVDKQLQISFDGASISNKELHQEQFELNESICSEKRLRFGSCEASSIKFRISNISTSLIGKKLTVIETLDRIAGASFRIGEYKVFSDKPTADRRFRDIVSYDAMYGILTSDVADWYNSILPNKDSTVTLKEFRDSFFAYFEIEQEVVELANDSMVVTKTIEPTQLSGKTVITSICEVNGCFGHIGRDGRFQYVRLKKIGDSISENEFIIDKSHCISVKYEDFKTELITKLQIRKEENDIGCVYGTGDNCYVVQDNFLLYGKSDEELYTVAENMYAVISNVRYMPAHVEARGNPCLEVGDGIGINANNTIIYTYILKRTMKGIQSLRDVYDADGEQYQSEKVNSVRDSIIQLKGKTNRLVRTVEETLLEIKDIEKGLNSRITHNAEWIKLESERAQEHETRLSAAIAVNAESINMKVSVGEVSSQLSIEPGLVSLKSNRFELESTNCTISTDGTIKASNVDLSGKIKASSGEIGGFKIVNSSLTSGASGSLGSPFGVYIGTDGISFGNSSASFKVTNAGVLTIDNASGSISFGSSNSGRMILDKDGISFGTSAYTTEITRDKIKIYNTYFEKDKVHCAKYSSANSYYTDINGNIIELMGSSVSYITTFTNSGISFGNSQEFSIESKAAGVRISNGSIAITGDTKISIGARHTSGIANQVLSFFGATGSKQITVSTATSSTMLTQLNALIDALKNYGLIG